MMLRRVSLFFIMLVLWDSIDDQCVAFAQRSSQGRAAPSNTDDDDDFIPFSLIYRAQMIDGIRASHFTAVTLRPQSWVPDSPGEELLYSLMSLQL